MSERITEQERVEIVSNDASILLTQLEEDEDGAVVESLRRASLPSFIEALKLAGINEGFQGSEDFENLKTSIVKKIVVSKEKISIEQLDGTISEYSVDIYPIVETLKKEDSVFVSSEDESGSRITFGDFLKALKDAGIHEGLMTTEEYEKQKSSIVKNVKLTDNLLSVVLLSGRKYEYTIDTTFFDSASVDEDGYFHLTKKGEDVVAPILIPALKEKVSEITCKKVGYVFEEEVV